MLSCTLTGADDSTDLDDLWNISSEFGLGLVEWGVLYSASNQGNGRYPSFGWIDRLTERLDRGQSPRFALHICGRAVKDFLEGEGHVQEVASAFPRIQVNFRAADYSAEDIKVMIRRNVAHTIVAQRNRANRDLWKELAGHSNHAILFDASGGRGLSPESWPDPLSGVACGYAGGLGPDNLETELPKIDSLARPVGAYWIDMEGKLREEQDRFDLRRARACLEVVQRFSSLIHGGEKPELRNAE